MVRTDTNSVAWVASVLLRQGMPAAEVRCVLRADDPEIIRRHLELHRERLAELLDFQASTVDEVERLLTDQIPGAPRAPTDSDRSMRLSSTNTAQLFSDPVGPGDECVQDQPGAMQGIS